MFKYGLSAICLCLACCGYSTRNIMPSHLKTIAIPVVENKTIKPGLSELLTEQLINDFTKDRSLKITTLQKANLVLNCKITNYERSPQSYTANQEVIIWKVLLDTEVSAEDKVEGTILWEGKISTYVTYDAQTETEDKGIEKGIAKMSQEIIKKVLTAW